MAQIPYGYIERHPAKRKGRPVYVLLAEGIVLLLVLGLLALTFYPRYEIQQKRSQVARVYASMRELVVALEAYQLGNPKNPHFSPGIHGGEPGIVLAPLQAPAPQKLNFLTTPVAYLHQIPIDPYVSQSVQDATRQTPIVLHWTRTRERWEPGPHAYEHVGWGALSFGPSLQLPPQYRITSLRRVPYNPDGLKVNLYDPSNGARSLGLIYCDSFGNQNRLGRDQLLNGESSRRQEDIF